MRLLGFVVVGFLRRCACLGAVGVVRPARADRRVDPASTSLWMRAARWLRHAPSACCTRIPREGELPARLVEFEQLLTDLDAVEKESLRVGARGLRLEMAKNSSERDVLRDASSRWAFIFVNAAARTPLSSTRTAMP